MFLIPFFTFLFGLIVGSFLNAVIYRLEVGDSVFRGRSYCPHCKHTLSWDDLVPLVSFLWLRGKCRYCHKGISWQYPLVELATAFLFLCIFSAFEGAEIFYLLVISSLLIILFVHDLRHYILPDSIQFSAIGVVLLYRLLQVWDSGFASLMGSFASAVGAAGFFLAIFLLSRGKAMGFGDVKLAFFMGLFLGWPNILVALFTAFLLGASVGIVLILLQKKGMKSEVPFGPFLITGTYFALFWGSDVVQWYKNLSGF